MTISVPLNAQSASGGLVGTGLQTGTRRVERARANPFAACHDTGGSNRLLSVSGMRVQEGLSCSSVVAYSNGTIFDPAMHQSRPGGIAALRCCLPAAKAAYTMSWTAA